MLKFDERTAAIAITGAANLFIAATSALGKVDLCPPASRRRRSVSTISSVSPSARDQRNFGGVVDQGFLPKDRAVKCAGEYNTIRKAADLRVMPHARSRSRGRDPRDLDWLHEDKN